MGLPEIGLKAIFENDTFLRSMGEYVKSVQGGEKETTSAGQRMTQGLATVGGAVVTAGLAAVATGIATISAACIASVPAVMDWAETLDGIGDVLGTSSDESAALAVAIEGVGGNVESITGQMAFLTKGLETNKGEAGNTAKAMDELGIAYKDANGQLLPSTQILTNVADVIGAMPDGLEKTRAMTQLFGKSGKDLSDVMGALANGGLEQARDKAQKLGLTLGDDTTDAAIQLGRSFKTIQMAVKGLFISLGSKLLPILQPLVERFIELAMQYLPEVQSAIGVLAEGIGKFVSGALAKLPAVIGFFKGVAEFLAKNKPLIVGALAAIAVAVGVWAYTTIAAAVPAIVAMVTASAPLIGVLLLVAGIVAALGYAWENNFMGMRDTLTAFWDNTVKPAFAALQAWLSENLPVAIAEVTRWWNEVLLPAIQQFWSWCTSVLFPFLAQLIAWLSQKLTQALQTLSRFWTNTLLPAIKAVWSFMNTSLFPLLKSLGNFLNAVLGAAIRGIAAAWESLQGPMQAVWAFITNTLWPKLQEFGRWLSDVFGPIFAGIGDKIREGVSSVFQWIVDKIAEMVKLLDEAAEWFNQLGLGGGDGGGDGGETPTADATSFRRSGLQARMPAATRARLGPATPAAASVTTNNVFNLGGQTINNGMDLAVLRLQVLTWVREAIR